jgi:hypothetical protein
MTSHRYVVCLLLLFGMLSAFKATDYLYPSEHNITVSYSNFTMDSDQYAIVKLNSVDTFLLKGGNIVTDQSAIEASLYQYYIKTFYPSGSEIDELEALIQRFNDSRNDGYDFKKKEEYICRDDVLMSNGKIKISGVPIRCTDNASCTKNAMLLYSIYAEGLNLGSPTTILQPLMDFTPSSFRMDELVTNYMYKLENLDDQNLADSLEYISSTSPELKPLSLKIEATIFRTPRLNDTADRAACTGKCYGVCPSFDLDQAAADSIVSKSKYLADRIGPLGAYTSSAALIYNRTATRMAYVQGEDQAVFYTDTFKPLNASGKAAISLAMEALQHITNKSLSAKLDDLKSLDTTIPEDISARNFTSLESDISQYRLLTTQVHDGAQFLDSRYRGVLDEKNRANGLIFVLLSKDLDPVSAKSMLMLQNKSDDLDVQFHDGLTLSKLEEFKARYSEVAVEAENLLKTEGETPATRVLLLFRGFARHVNTGIANVADETSVISRSEMSESPLPLGVFSSAIFLSLTSLSLLLFLYVLGNGRFQVPKTGHIIGAAFLVSVSVIFIFSALMFVFLDKTSNDATLPEFISDLGSKGSATLLVDLRNASLSDADAMRVCAAMLADSFSDRNKTWKVYTLTPNTCTLSNSDGESGSMGSDECIADADGAESSFLLSYAPKNQAPEFSTIYKNRAEIRANLDYYESCPLVALFS